MPLAWLLQAVTLTTYCAWWLSARLSPTAQLAACASLLSLLLISYVRILTGQSVQTALQHARSKQAAGLLSRLIYLENHAAPVMKAQFLASRNKSSVLYLRTCAYSAFPAVYSLLEGLPTSGTLLKWLAQSHRENLAFLAMPNPARTSLGHFG